MRLFEKNWPFVMMCGLIVAVLLFTPFIASAQTPGGKPAFQVMVAAGTYTFEGFGSVQQVDVDIDANRVAGGDLTYGTGWIVDMARTQNGFVTMNNDGEIFVYKNEAPAVPDEKYAAPNAMSIAVQGKTFLLPRYSGYVVRAVRGPQGLRTTALNKAVEIPAASITVTSDDYLVSYGQNDHRVVVDAIGVGGKLDRVNEFNGLETAFILAMSIAEDDLFVLGYHGGDTSCTLWQFKNFTEGGDIEPVALAVGVPTNPQFGGGNIMSAVFAPDGSLGVFLLDNSNEGSVLRLFQPGIGVRKVTSDSGFRYTAVRAFPADVQ